MNSYHRFWLRSVTVIVFFLLCSFASYADNLIPTRTPSTGYQPQFQVAGDRTYYVWHEYDGPYRQIFTAEMNVNGTGWKAEKRPSGQFDKVFPQLQVHGGKIYYVWEESDGKHRQVWTASVNRNRTGWKAEKRTKSPYGKYDPQFQIIENKIHYVWHEDHGPTQPIWSTVETLTE